MPEPDRKILDTNEWSQCYQQINRGQFVAWWKEQTRRATEVTYTVTKL